MPEDETGTATVEENEEVISAEAGNEESAGKGPGKGGDEKSGGDEAVGKEEKPVALKLPENSLLDSGAVQRTAAKAVELGLSTDAAQVLINDQSEAVARFADDAIEDMRQNKIRWESEVQADPEMGGEGASETVEMSRRALATFGTDELRKILEETGYGNHPELVRMFSRIGRAMAEKMLVMPNGKPQVTEGESPAEIMYGVDKND